MSAKLLTEHHLEFLSLRGGCRGSSESTIVKMLHCWKAHVVAELIMVVITYGTSKGEPAPLYSLNIISVYTHTA